MPFSHGQVVETEDICNRQQEIQRLHAIIKNNGRAVVYGRRRFGKSSVLKNIICQEFSQNNQRALGMYVDLFQVASDDDAAKRLHSAISKSLSYKVSLKHLWNNIVSSIRNFTVELSYEPLTNEPSISLVPRGRHKQQNLDDLFALIRSMSKQDPVLLILDEFQDIVAVPGLEAKLRTELQQLKGTVILSGSKRHVLNEMLSNEQRPFYGFGSDIEFGSIALKDWHPFIKKRFAEAHIKIAQTETAEILQLMEDVPNAIQELCQWLYDTRPRHTLTQVDIHRAVSEILESKASRFMERIVHLRPKERQVLIGLAQQQPVAKINQTQFVQATGVSASGIQAAVKRFYDQGMVDRSEKGYFLVDPLFRLYLAKTA